MHVVRGDIPRFAGVDDQHGSAARDRVNAALRPAAPPPTTTTS